MRKENSDKKYLRYHKFWLYLIIINLLIIVISVPVFAHKVNIFAYVEGDKVYTESYFNDGKKCVNSNIEVFDSTGNKLLEGVTNEDGEFTFEIPEKEDLKIVLTASMGHRAEYIIKASELGDVIESNKENIRESLSPKISSVDLTEIQLLIENTLDEKLKPLMREIKKSRENKISVTEIIGGIGYIFGIMGIIAYFLSRKNR